MTKEKHLYRILFLISIFLLLFNDLYLKYEYHNYLTGKLSDFAGLFAFPYFFSCLFPKKNKVIYIFSGILFVLWKSEFSQPFFDFANSYGIGIDRTVDYSDFISLLILPVSYIYWKSDYKKLYRINKVFKPIVISTCCFAFIATTLPKESGKLNLKSNYEVQFDIPKDTILRKMFRYYSSNDDPNYEMVIELPENRSRIFVKTIVSEIGDDETNIKLDSILFFETEASGLFGGVKKKNLDYVKNLGIEDFEKLFIEQKIKNIRKK